MTLNPASLIAELNRAGVDYVVVGGFAAIAHGVPRTTFDLDIVVDRSRENLTRLTGAMDALGAPASVTDQANFLELDPRDPFDLARSRVLRIPTRFGPLDLIADPPGSTGFAGLRDDASVVELDELTIPIVSRDTLITLKRASGRPKDLGDVADLEREI